MLSGVIRALHKRCASAIRSARASSPSRLQCSVGSTRRQMRWWGINGGVRERGGRSKRRRAARMGSLQSDRRNSRLQSPEFCQSRPDIQTLHARSGDIPRKNGQCPGGLLHASQSCRSRGPHCHGPALLLPGPWVPEMWCHWMGSSLWMSSFMVIPAPLMHSYSKGKGPPSHLAVQLFGTGGPDGERQGEKVDPSPG